MARKLWKTEVAAAAIIVALAAQGGQATPASAMTSPETADLPAVSITETPDGFALGDIAVAKRARIDARPDARAGENVTVMKLDNGLPVILNEQYSLPSALDTDAEYAEAARIASKQDEQKPVEAAPDEPAIVEESVTSDNFPVPTEELKPHIAYAVTPTNVTFKLNHSNSYDGNEDQFHALYLEEKLIGVYSTDSFTLQDLVPETEFSIKIVSSEDDPGAEATESEPGRSTTRMISITTPSESYEEAVQQANTRAAALEVPSQSYMHTTFIQDKYVDPGHFASLGCGGYGQGVSTFWFGGDNRNFGVPATFAPNTMPSYRSYVHVRMNYTGPDSTLMTSEVGVGETVKYLITPLATTYETKRASASGIKVNPIAFNRNYGQVVVNHSVGNPFCAAGKITFHDEVRFYRTSNTIEINGWRYPVPEHEISTSNGTYYAPGISWLPAYWGPTASFNCLLGTCARDNYSRQMRGMPII